MKRVTASNLILRKYTREYCGGVDPHEDLKVRVYLAYSVVSLWKLSSDAERSQGSQHLSSIRRDVTTNRAVNHIRANDIRHTY